PASPLSAPPLRGCSASSGAHRRRSAIDTSSSRPGGRRRRRRVAAWRARRLRGAGLMRFEGRTAVALLCVADCAESAAVVEAAGARTIALRCDVRLPADLERAVDQAEAALGTATLAVAAA